MVFFEYLYLKVIFPSVPPLPPPPPFLSQGDLVQRCDQNVFITLMCFIQIFHCSSINWQIEKVNYINKPYWELLNEREETLWQNTQK